MVARTLVTLAILAVLGNSPLLAEQGERAKVGDRIVIQMTEKLAEEYGKRTGAIEGDRAVLGLQIDATAIVTQMQKDGRICLEHSARVSRGSGVAQLVTLTAMVDPSLLMTEVTPKGTRVYASPAEHKKGTESKLTTKNEVTRRLSLSGLKDLKLRTWTLAEEIGE